MENSISALYKAKGNDAGFIRSALYPEAVITIGEILFCLFLFFPCLPAALMLLSICYIEKKLEPISKIDKTGIAKIRLWNRQINNRNS
jgi:hypothetical protein